MDGVFMNAYELADEFDWMTEEKIVQWCNDVVNMLRQQADRIAELEKETHSINYTCPNCETHVELFYKTPQIKELSDEEIDAVVYSMDWAYDPIKFAKAILKKASEK